MEDVSERSRGVALTLAGLTGIFGLHRFYAGKVGTGIAMLCTLGGMGIWWLYDCVLIVAGEFRDIDDRRITRWGAGPEANPAGGAATRRLLDTVEDLRGDVEELHERIDFVERMLTEVRERTGIPPGRQ